MYRILYAFLLIGTLGCSHSVNAANGARQKEYSNRNDAEIAQGFRMNDPTSILGAGRIRQDRTMVYDGTSNNRLRSGYNEIYSNPYGTYNYNNPYSAYPYSYANPYNTGAYPYYTGYNYNPGIYNPNTTFVNPPDSLNYPTGYPGYSESYYYGW
ncbi:MAG: hypothetical protein H0V82_10100 [Candidatus Protochlamydia sp.]|nr:hypothetical protein [Candidatus Protochlamydia sp.]